MEKTNKESKRYFSHGFTVLEETERKTYQLVAQTVATAPPREIDDLYPPTSEDEDWDKYPEMGNIEEEMHYLHIRPEKVWERRNDPLLGACIPIPTWPHELRLLFNVMFNMNENNTYHGLDMNPM
jgi:hypothetical protein